MVTSELSGAHIIAHQFLAGERRPGLHGLVVRHDRELGAARHDRPSTVGGSGAQAVGHRAKVRAVTVRQLEAEARQPNDQLIVAWPDQPRLVGLTSLAKNDGCKTLREEPSDALTTMWQVDTPAQSTQDTQRPPGDHVNVEFGQS